MNNKCTICQKEFEAKRSTAKFCSESCKQKNKRVVGVSADTIKDSVSDDLITIEKEIIEQEKKIESNYEETVRMGKEATEVLNSLSLEEIKKKGIWLPNWRRTNGKS